MFFMSVATRLELVAVFGFFESHRLTFLKAKNGITVRGSFIVGLASIYLTGLYKEPAMLLLKLGSLACFTTPVGFSLEAIELCWTGKTILVFRCFNTDFVASLFVYGVSPIIFGFFLHE